VFLEQNQMFASLGWQVASFAMHHAKTLSTPRSRYFVNEIEFGETYSPVQKAICAKRGSSTPPSRTANWAAR
jgi:hypothetical protein